jgi:hypothetical protein
MSEEPPVKVEVEEAMSLQPDIGEKAIEADAESQR